MVPAAIVAAVLVQVTAWRLVATGRASVWRLMIAVFALHGVVAVALGDIRGPGDHGAAAALWLGIASGIVLYAATRAFVGVAVSWPRFRRGVGERYGRAREVPLMIGLVLAVGVAVPGEELFWRGLVQGRIAEGTSPFAGAALAWVGYVVVNVASSSLPITLGAIVGGAAWAGLAWFTGGILASVICHGIWTALMLAFPPAAGRRMMPA